MVLKYLGTARRISWLLLPLKRLTFTLSTVSFLALISTTTLAVQVIERMTVRAAIDCPGDLTDHASSKILLKRRDNSGREVEIFTKCIIPSDASGFEVQPNDVVTVKGLFSDVD